MIFGDSSHSPAARRHLAYLPERFQLPYHQTGREFLQMMMRFHETHSQDGIVDAQLESLDLDPRCLEQRARTYSRAWPENRSCSLFDEQQTLIVLDEPMSGLDPRQGSVSSAVWQRRKRKAGHCSLPPICRVMSNRCVIGSASWWMAGSPHFWLACGLA